MATSDTTQLRAQCEAIIGLGTALRTQAMTGAYVVQPSDVLAIQGAVSEAMALEHLADSAGVGSQWARLIAAGHTLHYEIGQRTREPEVMTEGSEFIRLIEAMTGAAEQASTAIP